MESDAKRLAAAIESYRNARYAEAEEICRPLTSGPAPSSRPCFLLGLILGKTKRQAEGAQWLRRAAELDPAAPEVWSELGRACNSLDDYAGAAESFRRYIELRPANPDGYFCLGNACQQLGRHEEAVGLYRSAVRLNASDAAAWNNLGKALTELNRLPEAVAAFDQSLDLKPESDLARRNRAIALLKAGRWEEGWRDYEWRRSALIPWPGPQPKWTGERIRGKTLFIRAEQGLGDSIQFVRFVPQARARAGRVILECQKPLKRLFEHCGCADAVVAAGEDPPPFDTHVALASLPGIVGARPDSVVGEPYLKAPPCDAFPAAPGDPRVKVGLVWAGNAGYQRDAERSMPLDMLSPLLGVGTAAFFSFQTVLPATDASCFRAHPEMVNLAGRLGDFLDTAALAGAMDLIISVDTAVAHLAGALGKAVWTLVPFTPDWRWLLERSDMAGTKA